MLKVVASLLPRSLCSSCPIAHQHLHFARSLHRTSLLSYTISIIYHYRNHNQSFLVDRNVHLSISHSSSLVSQTKRITHHHPPLSLVPRRPSSSEQRRRYSSLRTRTLRSLRSILA